MGNILPIPELPKNIEKAYKDGKLVIFLGAGVSRLSPIGCKGWGELANEMIDRCSELKIIDSYEKRESLKAIADNKEKISVVYSLFLSQKKEKEFYEIMRKSFNGNTKTSDTTVYDVLKDFKCPFITTNADKHFDRRFNKPNIHYRQEEFNNQISIETGHLYHIHGSIDKPASMVFTVGQYLKRYQNDEFKEFLGKIFKEHTVLFCLYGLSEFELLDYIFEKCGKDQNGKTQDAIPIKHYILMPLYSWEEPLYYYKNSFYNELGIEVFPFQLNQNGYEQFTNVMKNWRGQLMSPINSMDDIDGLISAYSQANTQSLLAFIQDNESLINYTFRKLTEDSNPVPWMESFSQSGYFDPAKNPPRKYTEDGKNYTDYRWNVMPYLLNVANKLKEAPDDSVARSLQETVDAIIEYKDANGNRIVNSDTNWWLIRIISTFVPDRFENTYVDFIQAVADESNKIMNYSFFDEIGEKILPAMVSKPVMFLEILRIILSFDTVERRFVFGDNRKELTSKIYDEYTLKNHLEKIKPLVPQNISMEAAKIGIEIMQSILAVEKYEYIRSKVSAIEDHEQDDNHSDHYPRIILDFTRDMLANAPAEELRLVLKGFLKRKYPIWKRLAIHVINHRYDELADLFWNLKSNPLTDPELKRELIRLLSGHSSQFKDVQKTKIGNWIEDPALWYNDNFKSEEDKEQYIAREKEKWYLRLDARLKDNPGDEADEFNAYTRTNWRMPRNDKAELAEKTIDELILFLSDHAIGKKRNDQWDPMFIESILSDAVADNPSKYSSELVKFKDVEPLYLYGLTNGFKGVLRNDKPVDWEKILNFFEKDVLSDDTFWYNIREKNLLNDHKNWLIGNIADIIREGAKDQNAKMPIEYAGQVKSILLQIAGHDKSLHHTDTLAEWDISRILNTAYGKLLCAMMEFSLFVARSDEKDNRDTSRWDMDMKAYFDALLDRPAGTVLEYSDAMGMYLRQLLWLDKDWVLENIEKIFPQDKKDHWHVAFTAYLSFTDQLHQFDFRMFKEHEHFKKAIVTDFKEDFAIERLADFLSIAYLNEDSESLDKSDSLMVMLLDEDYKYKEEIRKQDLFVRQLQKLAWYFQRLSAESCQKYRSKIMLLWDRLYTMSQGLIKTKNYEDNDEFKNFISTLGNWIVLLDGLNDKDIDRIAFSFQFFKPYELHRILETMNRLADKNFVEVGKLFNKLLENKLFPVYEYEDVRSILTKLYESKNPKAKEQANMICETYANNGNYSLNEIYRKYNPK